MQQQKQNVLVPAKRKQMRSQRHLARKIKTDLQRSRQRTRKLTFAYRAYRKPHAPRSPSPLNRSQRRTRRIRIPKTLDQPRYRRRLEQAADRYLNIKARTDAADQTRRQQRMPAKRKKVVVNPDTLQTQYLGKQRAQQLLSRIARKSQNPRTNLRRRQRPAVKLPVRSQRKTIQNNDR